MLTTKNNIPIKCDGRVHSGLLQFENDWPGLFLRGDDCIQLLSEIDYISRRVNLDAYLIKDIYKLIRDEIIAKSK